MQAFFPCLLATTMLPTEVIMPSTFSVILGLGLYHSLAGIIIPSIITATLRFILGQRDISEWDAFQSELEASGLQSYVDLVNGARDRFVGGS